MNNKFIPTSGCFIYSVELISETDFEKPLEVCLDIQNVLKDIMNGFEAYNLDERNKVYYFNPINLSRIIQKEQEFLKSRNVLDMLAVKRAELLSGDFMLRVAFFQSLALLVKTLIAVNPGQYIIHTNLPADFANLYQQTNEYIDARVRDFRVGEKLVYNPFDKEEREIILSPEEIGLDEIAYENYLAANPGRFSSVDMVRENLDLQINTIKSNILSKLVYKSFLLETSSESLSDSFKITHAYDFFKKLKYGTFSLIGQFQAIYGGVCIRNTGTNLVRLMNYLDAVINTEKNIIPELNLLVNGDIPEIFKDCFTDVLKVDDAQSGKELELLISFFELFEKEFGSNSVLRCQTRHVGGSRRNKTKKQKKSSRRRRYEYSTRRSPYLRIAARK